MKILIADKLESFGITELNKGADELVCEPGLKDSPLAQRVSELDPAILIVRSTKVNSDTRKSGKQLKVVIRAGSGAAPQRSLLAAMLAQPPITVPRLVYPCLYRDPGGRSTPRSWRWSRQNPLPGKPSAARS